MSNRNLVPAEIAHRIALNAALLMFQSGELSAGAAAELAEVDRFTFSAECRRLGIPLVDYPVEDLGAELAALRPKA
jgi:predicted HTH domain antitoxin